MPLSLEHTWDILETVLRSSLRIMSSASKVDTLLLEPIIHYLWLLCWLCCLLNPSLLAIHLILLPKRLWQLLFAVFLNSVSQGQHCSLSVGMWIMDTPLPKTGTSGMASTFSGTFDFSNATHDFFLLLHLQGPSSLPPWHLFQRCLTTANSIFFSFI